MSLKPFLRRAGDGTYELLLPLTGGVVHILPYCFHSEADAADWLVSHKGRERIRAIVGVFDEAKRTSNPVNSGRRPSRLPVAAPGSLNRLRKGSTSSMPGRRAPQTALR
jgi:hypothetical protein